MSRPALWITAIVIFGIALVIMIYQEWFAAKPLQTWDLVPAESPVVWEAPPRGGAQFVEGEYLFPVTSFFPTLPDSVLVPTVFTSRSLLVSVHPISRDDFNYVWYVDLSRNAQRNALQSLFALCADNKAFQVTDRKLDGITIHEIRAGGRTYSFLIEENILAASTTSFLLEDVVRMIRDRARSRFRQSESHLFRLSNVREDDGNLYLNFRTVNRLASAVVSQPIPDPLLAVGLFTDLKLEPGQWLMNGFLIDSLGTDRSWLNILEGQQPVRSTAFSYVPTGTFTLEHLAFSNPALWNQVRMDYMSTTSRNMTDSLSRFVRQLGFDWQTFIDWLGTAIAIGRLPSGDGEERFVLVNAMKAEAAIQQLNKLAASTTLPGDSLYVESFGSYQIGKISRHRIPAYLFWPLVAGFGETFYSAAGDYIVMTESDLAMRAVLSAIEEDRTWGKATDRNAFLETTLREYNYGWYLDTEAGWDWLMRSVHPRWKELLEQRKDSVLENRILAFQASRLEDKFYTNLVLARAKRATPDDSAALSVASGSVVWEHRSGLSRLFPVTNHQTRTDEFLIQDSLNSLHLISSAGKRLWSMQLKAPIQGAVHQIDYLRNRKLQYFFTAGEQLYLVDRNGRPVPPFPRKVGTVPFEFSTVVDYDNSRRYRFLIADTRGNLYLLDASGKPLEGWKPMTLDRNLASAPQHFRMAGKDYLLAISTAGRAHLFNRRGDYLPGFPVDLDDRILGDPTPVAASGSRPAGIRMVTEGGTLIHVGLDGSKQFSDVIPKQRADEKFAKIHPPGRMEFISAHGSEGIRLFTSAGELLFKSHYPIPDPLTTQGYDLGASRFLFILHDPVHQYSYVYRDKGTPLTGRPIESGLPMAVRTMEQGKKLKLYYLHANRLETTTVVW